MSPDVFHSVVPAGLVVVDVDVGADRIVLMARPESDRSGCPLCGRPSSRVHSYYERRLSDLPWHGHVVELQLQVRRFRCGEDDCPRKVFTERLGDTIRPKARRTARLGASQCAIGLAVGGAGGSRLAHKLAMPVSGDTVLRLIRAADRTPIVPPRVIGIDDWAWRRGLRYGTIICDLERNQVIDLLPDRTADSVAAWLKGYPGVEIIARDRAGLYADGARRGAPGALQVADRWHLLNSLGETLRNVVGRHRKALVLAQEAIAKADLGRQADHEPTPASETTLHVLRARRRRDRRDVYAEIRGLQTRGLTPSAIAPIIGMAKRTVQRWLAAGGEPDHRRPPVQSTLIDPFRDHLVQRWQDGCHVGEQLWKDIKARGFKGSRVTVARWAAAHRAALCAETKPPPTRRKPPSRRRCAWLLSQDPERLHQGDRLFIDHLFEAAPELAIVNDLACRFVIMLKGKDDSALDRWLDEAQRSDLVSFASGLERDIEAVRAAITQPWTTSPVEGQINRVKMIKRQMYGRANYPLLKQRVLMTA